MRFGLEEHIITALTEVFEASSKVDKALLFGSRAKGNYRPDSDIDIAVKGKDITLDDILKMQVAIEEKGINFKVDLVNYNAVKEDKLIEHIDRVGIEMYTRWMRTLLGNIGVIVTGKTPSSSFPDEFGNDMPFVTPTDYRNYNKWISTAERNLSKKGLSKLRNKILPANSILTTCIGTDMGKVAINKVPVITNQQINSIIPYENVDSNFLYYKLISIYNVLRTYGEAGTAVPILNKSDFESIAIELPRGKKKQEDLSEILSSIDDKIDLLNRQNKILEQLAETLFRQWFIANQKIQLSNEPLGELIETTLGGDWGKDVSEGDYIKQVCCIRGTDVADLQTGLAYRTPVRFVTERKFESIEPKDGDIILEISGGTDGQSTGRAIYINKINAALFPYPLVFSNFCRLLRPQRKEYSYFVYLYIQYLYKQDEFFNIENGSSGIKNLDYKYLLFELEFPLPKDKGIILEFNSEVENYFEKINKNKLQILALTGIRDSLLPKLMSGEIRIDLEDSQSAKPTQSKKANVRQ